MATVKYKIKTANITSEYFGELKEGIAHAFCCVDNAADRLKLIADLQEKHAKILAWEAEREKA